MTQKNSTQKIEEMAHLGKADIHIHTNHSDAKPSVKEVLDYVQNKTDLDVIAICDHDTLSGALEAQEMMAKGNYRFDLIVGMEITSIQGHILGLFLKKKIEPGMDVKDTIEAIHQQGGLAVAAHPLQRITWNNRPDPIMYGIGLISLFRNSEALDGIEILNATPTLAEENYKTSLANKTFLFRAETGSSDAHILAAIGKGYTLFEGKTAADFREALKLHQTRGMSSKWTVFALLKYAFFFTPKAIRIFVNTVINGRVKIPED